MNEFFDLERQDSFRDAADPDILVRIADRLDGLEYGKEPSDDIIAMAGKNSIIIVYGGSDDLLEMRGAIEAEFGAWNGTTITSNRNREITAVWNDSGSEYSFIYETDIKHERFEVREDGEPYCLGIVFFAFPGEIWGDGE